MPKPDSETPDKQPAAEMLEQIAERLMLPAVGKVAPAIWNEMVYDVLEALRNERERCAKVATDHYAKGSAPECEGGEHCGIAIAKAIREGK